MYNLTVTDLVNGQVYCYMWDQTIAKRDSSEVGSCINMFINNNCYNQIDKLTFFSDNCPGQNKNHFII